MLKFKEFISEDTLPFASTQREVKANLDDPTTIDELNRYLAQVAAVGCVNPYGGLQNVSKVLSTYGITLPRVNYLPEPIGEQVFEVEQWGAHPGYNNYYNSTIDGIRTNSGIPIPYQAADDAARKSGEKLYVYYTWKMNENGLYDTFCMLVDKEGISTIMGESFLENLEPINEISKSTLKSYAKKVSSDEKNYDTPRKFRNRVIGLTRARMKLSKGFKGKVKIKAR